MTKIVDIEDIRKKREKKEIGIPIENINKKELKRRGHEIGDILGCDEKGEEICVRKGKGNLYVDGDMEKEQLFDFMRSQIYQNIQRGDSMVIVDLGSRIYKRELWIYLTIHGYRVDSYNMDCMTESDCFNCLDGLGAENEEQIVMIANDIIDDQKYKFMTYPVETACKALLSAVLLASLTEMEESDRNMLEIATIFRLGVSGTMLDKILHVMFEELDETSSAKQLFAMYSEAEEGIRMEAIQKFALKAACEIVDRNGKTIFKKGDTIATTVSGDDQFGYLEFFGLPTGIYAKDGVGKEMYTVEEIEAPLGYNKSDEKLTFGGEVLNNTAADFIHDVASQGNTNTDETTYKHDSKTIVNTPSDYVQVKKCWIDDNNSMNTRPVSVTIKAEHKNTHEVKTYVLNKDNNWAMQTDIKRGEEGNYTFSEVCNAANYTRVSKEGGDWDKNTYTLSYTNKYDKGGSVKLVVKKNWDDSNNSDGIRPDSVNVKLYRNGTDMQKDQTLSAANNWSAEFNDLPKTDDLGEKYEYEVKEDSSSVVNGNAKTGYEIAYEVKESTDKSSDITTITTNITNTHSPDSTTRSIQKKWSDNNDSDGIRPDSVKFNLVGNGKVADTVTLSEKNGWKATSKLVPKKENGKAITYTWQEVQEGVVTGESQIGYKSTYTTDKDDPDTTIATNTHTPGRGKVTITKEIDPSNLNMDIGSAKFTFTLKGTDAYGKKHTYKEEIEFSKDEVAKQLKAHPGERIKLSATFDDLIYGTYTCSESGGEKYFKLLTLTSDSTNATVDQSKGTVTFKIGPEGAMGNAKLTADATFVNQMIRGSVKLVKKDSSGKRLKGVEFTIEDSDGNKIASDTTNENGEIKFDGLLPDKYKITETKTQSGKTLLKEPINVTIPMTVTQSEVNDQNIDVSNAIHQGNNYYFYHLTYEVSNDSTLNLPSTGGFSNIKTYLPLIGGFVLILAAGFYYLKKKKGMKILKKKK